MEVTVTEARARLSELMRVAKKEPVIITKRGKRVAVLISYEEYVELRDYLMEAGLWPYPKKPQTKSQ
ncbi:MAG: type II toxin-antitoxin system Phd/YefM family antitoxin [Anaerolineae bacterium]